jgi:hypothetical protein
VRKREKSEGKELKINKNKFALMCFMLLLTLSRYCLLLLLLLEKTSLITPDISLLLKYGTQTLIRVNLEYPSFNFFSITTIR